MFDFWLEMPRMIRVSIALGIIAITAIIWFFTGRLFYVMGIIGIVLLFAAGAGNNKSGYNF